MGVQSRGRGRRCEDLSSQTRGHQGSRANCMCSFLLTATDFSPAEADGNAEPPRPQERRRWRMKSEIPACMLRLLQVCSTGAVSEFAHGRMPCHVVACFGDVRPRSCTGACTCCFLAAF